MILVRTVIAPLIFLLLTVSSCHRLDVKPEKAKKVKVIGHGGAGFQSPRNQLPHNSMESGLKAVEFYGAHGVEMDVQLSKSGSFWMYHDLTLETQTQCMGCVIQKTDNQLANCRFNNDVQVNVWNGPYALKPAAKLIHNLNLHKESPVLIIDVRSTPVCSDFDRAQLINQTAEQISFIQNTYNDASKLYFILRDKLLAEQVAGMNAQVQILLEVPFSQTNLEFMKRNGLSGVSFHNRDLQKSQVEHLQNEGFLVCLFGAKTQSSIPQAINKSPDFLITDNIPLTLNVLKAARD